MVDTVWPIYDEISHSFPGLSWSLDYFSTIPRVQKDNFSFKITDYISNLGSKKAFPFWLTVLTDI